MELDKPIAIAVILFIILVLGFYLVIPKYRTFQDLLINLGKKEAELQGKAAYFVEVTKTYKELMQYQENLKKIETALPDNLAMAPLINFIYQKGAENGVIIKNISILKNASVGANTKIKETNVSLNLFGSYNAFKSFLTSIEKSARLMEGGNISFSVTPPSLTSPLIQETYPIKLDIKAYSY
ncbi:type 4a pilus biogenesis protein PilO [Patescibacteria group bacterium]|nr:type 4a pilus biogenesis protein PilO [Patescibacteria group bacterium]MBU4367320.1 type 4a pilus biogenesis protein PilO [Patescibacteria group bacterium]MBU4461657.1 type 4a pilus biogenesis protein PilO [Patescibacteria group bacterium]MCG2699707.1 type 4a pilus biogenesis protein PilO [Candidatus Parcubacteria bacterium]